jgi:lipopolysaccharide exporter
VTQHRRYSILGGALITVATRWSDRLIGFVSTIVLARLLAPEDFGVIAMASVIIGLADVLLDLGVNIALIRNANATQAHYDTAWTLRLAQTSLATLALILAAPAGAEYFHEERVGPVLQVLAFSVLLSGFENIGIVSFQKLMQFGAEFRYLFMRRIAGFVITIVLAWLLRSYWALVIGAVSGRAIGVALSYILHPMRPRLSLEKFGDIFAVSQWVLLQSIGTYLQINLHKILVGRWASTPIMGAYSLADDISAMPTAELLAPLNRVLFPAFSAVQHHLDELKRLYMRAQGVQTLIAVPAAVGLALVADDAVRVLLGEKWLAAVPFVQLLALVSVTHALITSGNYVLIVLGRIRSVVFLTWAKVLVFATLAVMFLPQQDALGVASLRLFVAAGGIWFSFRLVINALPILRWHDILRASTRPLACAGAMTAVLIFLPVEGMPPTVSLLAKIALAAAVYVISVLTCWWLVGRPDGAESYLIRQVQTAFAGTRP